MLSLEVKAVAAKAVPAGKMHLFKKACQHVESGAARLDGSEVVIDSQSDPGTTYRYGIDGQRCTCPAGVTNRWCYHLSCRDLLVVAAMLEEQQAA